MRYFYALLAVSGWIWLALVLGYLIVRWYADRRRSRSTEEVERND